MLLAAGHREVHGIDLSPAAVARARQRGVQAVTADLERPLPYAGGSFDAVVAGEIIEHIYNVDQFLSEIHRVLRPGGTLNRNPHIEISFTGDAAGHIRYFIKSTLVGLLEAHGFSVEVVTSDVVNLSGSGRLYSRRLAKLVPTLGRCLVVKASKPA
jgi:SAM-dependent methyltransferase